VPRAVAVATAGPTDASGATAEQGA
jgi:hypothetical protein